MKYKWDIQPVTESDIATAKVLARDVGMGSVAARLLATRGIRSAEEARRWLRPQLQDLHDPFLMRDMDKAVARLNEAMGQRERIMIWGDYDVDGCTAVALVYKFLSQFYSNIECHIPDRGEEGYGVSCKGVDMAVEHGVSLVVVLDCGIKAGDEIGYAAERGVDFIVCDHHVPDDELPPAVAVLNAKRADNTYPYTDLSGCGVGFKLMQAFAMSNGIPFDRLMGLLDLCAISIASDIVPVTGENRILAYHGLRQMNAKPSVGVAALVRVCGLEEKELTMSDIVFKIGPRLNASGRLQNGLESVSLLVERNKEKALALATTLDRYNEERKELDRRMTEEAISETIASGRIEGKSAIVLYDVSWHRGVIGIVASRLTEEFFRPAVVLTRDGDTVTGSARSVGGFDVYAALQSCADLLDNFGGHTYAAGLSMRPDCVERFILRFEAYVATHISSDQMRPELEVHAVLDFGEISRELLADIKRMRPFGPGNPKPLFCTYGVFDYGTSKVVGRKQEHIKLELVDSKSGCVMNGIAFGQSSQVRYIKTKSAFDIVYSIEENAHRHGEIQLQIEDIRTRVKE